MTTMKLPKRNLQLPNQMTIEPFQPRYQDEARALIICGLGERWGFIDETLNPDLVEIAESFSAGCFLVARVNDVVVGTGGCIPAPSNAIEIRRMSVARNLRRQGVGARLLESLLTYGRAQNAAMAVLETTDTWTDAISFYERFGFSKYDQKPGEVYLKYVLS